MENNLSQRICEACGIEIKRVCYYECGKIKTLNMPCQNKWCEHRNPDSYEVDFKYNYFNFIMLLELRLEHNTDRYRSLGELLFYLNIDFWDRDTFLKGLLYYLTSNNFDNEQVESVKSSIRKTTWKI